MRLLYTVLHALGFVVLSPVFLYKMWKRGKYRENFSQRFGSYAPEVRQRLEKKLKPRCWIQAVSVGEVNLTLRLLQSLRHAFPQYQMVLTVTTSTGYALARERLPKEVELLYFPQDFLWTVKRAYNLIQPDFIILIESELWPNHVWEAARRGIPVFLVNGRMSPRSALGYQKVGWLFRRVFGELRLVCAQSPQDMENFLAAGVPRDRVHMTGNMKYDAALPQNVAAAKFDPAQILRQIGIAPMRSVLVAGSTHPGEDEILFDMLQQLRAKFPDLFLVLVPRHVERAPEIVELAKHKQVSLILRSAVGQVREGLATPVGAVVDKPDCLLVNTTGELRRFYQIATVIFVGKSLVGQGGQNIVEAAASGHPVVFGPHMENFLEISRQFVAEDACVQVQDVYELRHALQDLLQDEHLRGKITASAQRVIAANVGATDRTVELMTMAIRP
ncbi:MAG: 3-deoxy-D-manno-octulosonic acid transferase [Verrucomicrobiia bacterium]